MTMMMMQRLIESAHKTQDKPISSENQDKFESSPEPQLFLQAKRIEDDSRDAEMCENKSESDDEELNVDVENDELCPVDLTRRQEKFGFDFVSKKSESSSDFVASSFKGLKDGQRSESVCSDVSRSDSPRDNSPSVVLHQNRRLAFSVENILDPNKFTGRQPFGDGLCCWKPHQESLGSPEYDGSETGWYTKFLDL